MLHTGPPAAFTTEERWRTKLRTLRLQLALDLRDARVLGHLVDKRNPLAIKEHIERLRRLHHRATNFHALLAGFHERYGAVGNDQ